MTRVTIGGTDPQQADVPRVVEVVVRAGGRKVLAMTDEARTLPDDHRSARVEATQAVVDRITSWQDGATKDVVRSELLKALAEAGVAVPDTFVDEVVRRVNDGTDHFDVAPLLGEDG